MTRFDPFFRPVFVLLASRFETFSRLKSFQTLSPCCEMADRQSVTDCKEARSTQRKRTARNANRQQSVTDRRRQARTQAGTQAET